MAYASEHGESAAQSFRALASSTKRSNLDMIQDVRDPQTLLEDYQFNMLAQTQYGREMYAPFSTEHEQTGRKKAKHIAPPTPCSVPTDAFNVKEVKTGKTDIPPIMGEKWIGKVPFRGMMSGASGRGKTTLGVHLYNHFYADYFDEIWMWTPNFVLDDSYRSLKRPPTRVYEKFHPSQLKDLIERARKKVPTVTRPDGTVDKKKLERLKYSTNDLPSVLIWLDDMAMDAMQDDYFINMLACLARHLNISIMNLVQKYNKASRTFRTNLTVLFVFGTENSGELDDLAAEHTGGVLNPKQFKRMFNDVTGKHPWDFLTIMTAAPATEVFREGLNKIVDLSPYFDNINPDTVVASDRVMQQIRGKAKPKTKQNDEDEEEHGEVTFKLPKCKAKPLSPSEIFQLLLNMREQ